MTTQVPVDASIVEYTDIGEMTAGHPILNMRYVQLDRGIFQGDVLGIPLTSHGLFWRSRANLGGAGSSDIPADYQMAALPGRNSRQEIWHGRLLGADSLALGNHQTGLEHRAGSHHEAYAWLIPVDRYLREAQVRGLQDPVFKGASLTCRGTNGLIDRLWAVIDMASELADLTEAAARLAALRWFDAALVSATVECLATVKPLERTPRCQPSIARSARDLIHHHASNPLSMSDLCARLDVPERTLRYQFAGVYQCSPMEYQLALRLKLVQNRLREAEPSKGAVGRAAAAYGFWHMGRFTGHYRRLLGESPSQTLVAPRSCRSWLAR